MIGYNGTCENLLFCCLHGKASSTISWIFPLPLYTCGFYIVIWSLRCLLFIFIVKKFECTITYSLIHLLDDLGGAKWNNWFNFLFFTRKVIGMFSHCFLCRQDAFAILEHVQNICACLTRIFFQILRYLFVCFFFSLVISLLWLAVYFLQVKVFELHP